MWVACREAFSWLGKFVCWQRCSRTSIFFPHSVQIVLSTSPGPLNLRTGEQLNITRLVVFCILQRTLSLFQSDPDIRSQRISVTISSRVHMTSFVSLHQMLFVIHFITILVSSFVTYTLTNVLSPTSSPIRNFEGCLAVSTPVFLNCRTTARYRALASIITGPREVLLEVVILVF
jgi:hypothetical protein